MWAVVTDDATDMVWRKGLTEMTPDRDGPPHVGTNVPDVLQLGGRRYVTDTTVTEVGPGMSYRLTGAGTSGVVRGRRSVNPTTSGDTTLFTYDVELEPQAIPRLARPLLRWWAATQPAPRPAPPTHPRHHDLTTNDPDPRAVVASKARPPLPRPHRRDRPQRGLSEAQSHHHPPCDPHWIGTADSSNLHSRTDHTDGPRRRLHRPTTDEKMAAREVRT